MEQQKQAAEERQEQLLAQLREQQQVQQQMQAMTSFYMSQQIRPSPPGSLPASAPPFTFNWVCAVCA